MTTAINIPTGLSPNANGSYTHLATGFVVHDVWSIKDLLDANGAFAYSVVTGEWRWVAGTDLTAFIKAFGSATLGSLAAAMLAPQVMTIHGWTAGAVRGVGGSSQGMICPGAISWPGLTEPAQGDIRLFGLVNNLQAGHGCSARQMRVSDFGRNQLHIHSALVTQDPTA